MNYYDFRARKDSPTIIIIPLWERASARDNRAWKGSPTIEVKSKSFSTIFTKENKWK